MSDHDHRLTALNTARVDAGIEYCAAMFTHERVTRIDPESIDQDDDKKCIRAQASGMSYDAAQREDPLSDQQQIEFGFIGEFEMLAFDGHTKTCELTPIVRRRLREYQSRHRIAA